jgi:hypothetical protein
MTATLSIYEQKRQQARLKQAEEARLFRYRMDQSRIFLKKYEDTLARNSEALGRGEDVDFTRQDLYEKKCVRWYNRAHETKAETILDVPMNEIHLWGM